MTNISHLIDSIKYPIITEKSTTALEQNQYTFIVDKRLTKTEIKKAIEFLFKVKVEKVNTQNQPLKSKRVGSKQGFKPQYKKAIIRISKENRIDLFDI